MCVRAYRTRQSVLQILESLERVHVCVLDYVYLHMEYTRTRVRTRTCTRVLPRHTPTCSTHPQPVHNWNSLLSPSFGHCGSRGPTFGHCGSGVAYIWSFWFWCGLHLVILVLVLPTFGHFAHPNAHFWIISAGQHNFGPTTSVRPILVHPANDEQY